MKRKESYIIRSLFFLLCPLVIIAASGLFALSFAAPPTICLKSPLGEENFVENRRVSISWESPDFDTNNPDHNVDWLVVYYRWQSSSTLNVITSVGQPDMVNGSTLWTTPNVTSKRNLILVLRYELDGGTVVATDESSFITIIPSEDTPSITLMSPQTKADPDVPDPCDNPLILVPDIIVPIMWSLTGCDSVAEGHRIRIELTTNGVSYSTIETINEPSCDVLYQTFPWIVPWVDTTDARLRLIWEEPGATGFPQYVTSTWTRYPFAITTGGINRPPVADAGPDQTARAGERVDLDGTGSSDPDSDPITYSWVRQDVWREVYPVTLFDSFTAEPHFEAPDVINQQVDLVFRLSVDDGINLPDTDFVTISVVPDQDNDGVLDYEDNCPTISNFWQEDSDDDGLGNVCDECANDPDNDQDNDDYCGNIDNCPTEYNPDQEDYDSDLEGDACDCDDGYKGPFEVGADCGWTCGGDCAGDCVPLIRSGATGDKIDFVFIPTNDFPMLTDFRDAAMDMILNSLFTDSNIYDNRDRINFWAARHNGTVVDDDGSCDWDEEDWDEDCSHGDIGAILHSHRCGDSTNGNIYSSDFPHYATFQHELGHALFDLGDEYDDNDCSTHYHEADPRENSNIFRTPGRCEDHSLNPDSCLRFTECQSYWYKSTVSQPDNTVMESCPGHPNTSCDNWGDDAIRQVNHIFSLYTAGVSFAGDSAGSAEAAVSDSDKIMIASFDFDGKDISLTAAKVVSGEGPDRRVTYNNGLAIELLAGSQTPLASFTMRDPRYVEYAEPDGSLPRATSFSVAMPFFATADKIKIIDLGEDNSMTLGVFDLAPFIVSICAEYPDDPSCSCPGDFDGDQDVDGDDAANFTGGELALFADKYGRTNCPDLNPPDCDDGSPCTRDFFDPVTRLCVHRTVDCDDNNLCTTDSCHSFFGICLHKAVVCDDGNPCTEDSCDPATGGCLFQPKDCDDGDACTNDICDEQSGTCTHPPTDCDDGNPCTMDLCDKRSGCYYLEKVCIDDGDLCTTETCNTSTGQCETALKCYDANICTIDSCSSQTGECSYKLNPICQACCMKGSVCVDTLPLICQNNMGIPQGSGTSCATTTCP